METEEYTRTEENDTRMDKLNSTMMIALTRSLTIYLLILLPRPIEKSMVERIMVH
jgi:hypothetical protein